MRIWQKFKQAAQLFWRESPDAKVILIKPGEIVLKGNIMAENGKDGGRGFIHSGDSMAITIPPAIVQKFPEDAKFHAIAVGSVKKGIWLEQVEEVKAEE